MEVVEPRADAPEDTDRDKVDFRRPDADNVDGKRGTPISEFDEAITRPVKFKSRKYLSKPTGTSGACRE